MAITVEKINFEAGQGSVETNKIIFQLGAGTLICEKIKFFGAKIKDRPVLLIIPTYGRKRVLSIKCKAVLQDVAGEINLTDLIVQDGIKSAGYITNTEEMLRKLREDGQPTIQKFFNAVVRGRKTIIVPNRGEYLKIALDAPVVTAPIDFTLWAKQNIGENLKISHFYRTRIFTYLNSLEAGNKLEFLAMDWQVKHNDVVKTKLVDYEGLFHECPAGDSRFNIDLISEESTQRSQPSVRVLIDIQEWEKSRGTLKL